jgi:hypothetical protein
LHVWGIGDAHTGFWRGNLRERTHLSDLGVDGRITLKTGLQELGWEAMYWIELAQDKCR